MSSIIRTGIIGYGLSGRVFHAPFIDVVEGYELTKISTSKPENVKLIEERYPVTAVVPNGKGIIEDPEIDLVIVTSPNTEHFRWAREALIAGKHVVVEKPFTVNVAEADELIEIAQRQGKILTVYHNRRFTSDTKTVRKILESGILGEIVDYESHFDRYRPNPRPGGAWREDPLPGSGIFYDLGSHLIDQALWFFGMPLAVTADIDSQRPWAKADDHFDVRLHYPSFTATLKSGMLCKIPGPTYLIHGRNGSFVKYGLDVQEATLDAGAVPQGKDWGREPESIWGNICVDYKEVKIEGKVESEQGDYRDYFINLRDAINGKTKIAVKPEEARNVIQIIQLALQSSREKRTISI
ncbi:MAG: oxidoreductase [Dysgonomonadaceae bacterium]|jgi:predicted dehydrogenase|nr:oxidoreductase [Dysgonamonadaceae bacterium]MDK2837279.1 scyllo-inositol 2-dehydrogenase [Bacteroidota bacterium]HOT64427.1 oxidoreductase [Dysgonamonadaceae bacterium]HOV36335.1 oxidoreductase [Dysgonamonadaceae bacterium]HQG07496.1 oxidoreductase [Dysgonamonadaceae bacterium]